MNEDNLKIIIAHPDKQHSYKTAAVLESNHWLTDYVTTIYNKEGTITSLMVKLLPGRVAEKLKKFHCDSINNAQVRTYCEFSAILERLLGSMPILKNRSEARRIRRVGNFNRKVAALINKENPDVFIGYDTLCGDLLKYLADHKCRALKLVDMSAPCYLTMAEIIDDYSRDSNLPLELRSCFTLRKRPDRIRQTELELKYADGFLVASDFSAKTLMDHGISRDKIFKCPYDIPRPEVSGLAEKTLKQPGQGGLTGIYIGNINVMKGVHILTKALKDSDSCIDKFIFVGAVQDQDLLEKCNPKYLYPGRISHEEVLMQCKNADFSVFPSLCDGFGFAVSECLSLGLPVICSKNAGAADFITDGENGFLVDPDAPGQISAKIEELHRDRKKLLTMRQNALKSMENLSKTTYGKTVTNAIETLIRRKTK